MSQRLDVAIIGGGPAGTAAAIVLARAGATVAVIERSDYEHPRVGETLPPIARVSLTRLGVWDRFLGEAHRSSPGILSVWGQDELQENHFIFSPYGEGWHLDRRRFDAFLAGSAEEAGAVMHRHTRVNTCVRAPSGHWQMEVASRCGRRELRAEFLVDATGRAASLAQRFGATRTPCDRLIGVVGFLSASLPEGERDDWTLVEATQHGWWYSAFLPDARVVVTYMTDADLLPATHARLSCFWHEQLGEVQHTRARTAGYRLTSALHIRAADSYRLDPAAGENWRSTGDAAAAFDPLCSQGLTHALETGLRAAQSILEEASGSEDAQQQYADDNAKTFEEYLQARAYYYRREGRWPRSRIWQRRRDAAQ